MWKLILCCLVFSVVTQTSDQSYRNFVCVFVTSTDMLNHTYASANLKCVDFQFRGLHFYDGATKEIITTVAYLG